MKEKEIKDFAKSTKDWMALFTSVYQTKHTTPYMHACIASTLTNTDKEPWQPLDVFTTRTRKVE